MKYINKYSGEKFEDRDDCVQSILEYQADLVSELHKAVIDILNNHDDNGDLHRAWEYVEACMSYTDDLIEVRDDGAWELLVEKYINETKEEGHDESDL